MSLFVKNIGLTYLTEIFLSTLSFFTGILLARLLTVEDRGVMVLVTTLPITVMYLTNLGLPQANIYFIGRKGYAPKYIYGNALLVAAITGILVVLLLQPLKGLILGNLLKGLPEEYWVPLMVIIPLILITVNQSSIISAFQRFDLYNLIRVSSPVFMLIGLVIFLWIIHGTLPAALIVYFVATILTSGLGFLLTRQLVPIKLKFDLLLTIRSLRFGLKSFVETLFISLNYRLDVFLVAYFLDSQQVALYGVAVALAEVAWNLPNSIGAVLYPRLTNMPYEQVNIFTAKTCRTALALSFFLVLALSLFGWILLPLVYGPAYARAIPALLALLPGILCMSVYKVLTRDFTSRDQQQYTIIASAISLVIITGLDLLLIPHWKIFGAAIASTAGYSFATLLVCLFFVHESKLSFKEILFLQAEDITALKQNWRLTMKGIRG